MKEKNLQKTMNLVAKKVFDIREKIVDNKENIKELFLFGLLLFVPPCVVMPLVFGCGIVGTLISIPFYWALLIVVTV